VCSSDLMLELNGQVNNDWLSQIEEIDCDKPILNISSVGGEIKLSLKVAEAIEKKNLTIVIDSYCFSACAEFLLPAAKHVIFRNAPLIGFHGNPILVQFLAEHNLPPGIQNFPFLDANRMKKLYKRSNTNPDFWDYQLKHLKLSKFLVETVNSQGKCPNMDIAFEHDLWFPSSISLREDLWLKFDGDVCADNVSSCFQQIDSILPKKSFVVDEYTYLRD